MCYTSWFGFDISQGERFSAPAFSQVSILPCQQLWAGPMLVIWDRDYRSDSMVGGVCWLHVPYTVEKRTPALLLAFKSVLDLKVIES